MNAPDYRRIVRANVHMVTQFLMQHAETSMFALSNLASFRLDGDAPFAVTGWRRDDDRAAVFVTNSGMVMLQVPDPKPWDWQAVKRCLPGCEVTGVSGAAEQVRACQALGFTEYGAFGIVLFETPQTVPPCR